jgi:hypothetical protein
MYTMPLQLTRYAAERFVDMVIDRIIGFTDYFILTKHITLSETSLFSFSATWFLWICFAPGTSPEAALMSRASWATLFGIMTLSHFVTFFFADIMGRAMVSCVYACVWAFLFILTILAGSTAPAAPTLLVLTGMSVFIAVRLFRERRLNDA